MIFENKKVKLVSIMPEGRVKNKSFWSQTSSNPIKIDDYSSQLDPVEHMTSESIRGANSLQRKSTHYNDIFEINKF